MARRKAGDSKVAVGNIREVSGEVNIAGGNIGYSARQVSILLRQITTTLRPKPFDGRCPYKGLDVFEEEDADLFFGRERLVEDLLNRVKELRTVFITGPSGSGKSSLVRAGLIHALKQGAIKSLHSERWLYETMKPGREPIKELSLAFSRLKSPELAHYFQAHANDVNILNECAESVLSGQKTQRFVLFVDQFEEAFTQINQEEERQAFINMLAHAGTVENGRVIVLFAMRSDFVSNCATYPALNELLSQQFRQIGAMQPEELVSAIALPARHVGLPIEDELIARIINDMKGEPGALPLMQFALKDLFDSQQEQGGVVALTLKDYLQHGGIQKSLEHHADASLAALDEKSQDLARSIFSGLIEIGRGTVDTKRTALFDELVPADTKATDVEFVVQRLADARLIITDEQAGKDTVTISHEKLIDAWPWLKKLVNENRDVIALQNEIASDAKEWEDHTRDSSYLYIGARLAKAHEQLEAKKLILSGTAYEFVQAGHARKRRSRLVVVSGISIVIALLIFAVIVFGRQSNDNAELAQRNENTANTAQAASTSAAAQEAIAQANAEEAQKQATISRSQALAANSQLQKSKSQLSLLLAVEAFGVAANLPHSERLPAEQAVRDSLSQVSGIPLIGSRPVFSPDGHWLATTSDGKAHLLNIRDITAEPVVLGVNEESSIIGLGFSSDGGWLATVSYDGAVRLWDMKHPTAQPIILHGQETLGQETLMYGLETPILTFSRDGRWLAVKNVSGIASIWDMKDLTAKPMVLPGQESRMLALTFSPDGRWLATASYESTVLWDMQDPTAEPIILDRYGNVSALTFSPDGRWLATASYEGIVLWDMQDPAPEPIGMHEQPFVEFATFTFSPDGRWLATASYEGIISLWDIQDPTAEFVPLLSGGSAIAFSPTGRSLATGSDDGTVRLWDPRYPTAQLVILRGYEKKILTLAFSPDGRWLAAGGDDVISRLWDLQGSGVEPIVLRGQEHELEATILAFSPDGRWLTTNFYKGSLHLWDMKDPTTESIILRGYSRSSDTFAFSPDGRWLATASEDSTALLWDMKDPIAEPSVLRGHEGPITTMAFSPDGRWLTTVSGIDETFRLWDMKDPTTEPIILQWDKKGIHTFAFALAFGPDGRWLAAKINNDTSLLWDMKDLTAKPMVLPGGFPAFSPNGRWLATASANNTVRLKDLRYPMAEPIILGNVISIDFVAFSPDGDWLATGSTGSVDLWNLNDPVANPIELPGSMERQGRTILGFSPDGRWLAIAGDAAIARLWDMKDPVAEPIVLRGHEDSITTLAFSPDGRWLATGSDDGATGLWDLKAPAAEPIFLRGDGYGIVTLVFSPDGPWLTTGSRYSQPRLWNLDIGQVVATACKLVGRNFTPEEWAQYFPNEAYRKTCEQWRLEGPPVDAEPTPIPSQAP